jgi:hypothetical protein
MTGLSAFAKDKICQSDCPINAGLEELWVSIVQINRCFGNLRAVF